MNKKNIGAALSVVAAVTAGATVYASTINNLESDKNTNSMITPYYADTTYDYYSLVKSDYTQDLKNTAIANEKRVVQNTKDTREEVEKIEKAAREIVATTINVTTPKVEQEVVRTEVVEEPLATEEPEVVEVVNEPTVVEEATTETKLAEEETSEQELVVYDDTNLDDVLAKTNKEEDLEVVEDIEIEPEVAYLEENEATEEVKETLTRYINAEALNLRSGKDVADSSNIVRTLVAGDEVKGTIDGDWFKTDEGYLSLSFLSEAYPEELVNKLNNPVEPVEEEVHPVVEETKEVVEAPENKEEANTVVEEVKEEKQEVKGQAFTGWVYNTKVLNVRDKAQTGNIIGTLPTATKVAGEILDGWVKFDYNGKTAFVSAAYLSTNEPTAPVEEAKKEEAPQQAIEEVVYEEEVEVEEAAEPQAQQAAPAVSQNGQQAASIASQYAGHPYVWGSSNPAVGFDCSGLVVNAYRQLGVSLPHSSAAQYSSGYAVDASNLQPGDLVFFAIRGGGGIDHVGIVTSSDGTFIHASTPSTGVVYDNVYNNHYQKSFVGARRIF